jgi:hypothetical protein
VPQTSIRGNDAQARPRRLSESKPATSAITSLRDDEVTERRHGYQNNFLPSLPLDTAQKPYYSGSKYPHVSTVLPRRPCLALHRRALPVQTAANHRESISACRRDDLGVANDHVTPSSNNKPTLLNDCS